MSNDDSRDWENATWKGNRKAQLRASLKLTPRQRFEALEELAETSEWLARAGQVRHFPDAAPREGRVGEVREQPTSYDGDMDASADRKQE